MTPDPPVVPPEAPIAECARELAERGLRHLAVVDPAAGRLEGLVAARDVFRAGSWVNGLWAPVPRGGVRCARDVARPAELVVRHHDPLASVLPRQLDTREQVAVVVDDARRPIGLITEGDGSRAASRLLQRAGASRRRPVLISGRYELLTILGRGGAATVYKAWDRRLEIERALKILRPEYLRRADVLRRFDLEARTLARLRHVNIVTVHDLAQEPRPYLVMELLERGSLADWTATWGPMPAPLAVGAVRGVLQGLIHAHQHGVVHRDVKPRNVLLTEDGVPKLADFGVARVRSAASPHTGAGASLGTDAYMAPEQRLDARSTDERADVYGAGATLFALLADANPAGLLTPGLRDDLLAEVPPPLAEVIAGAVARQPADRYRSAMAMCDALDAAAERLDPMSAAVPPLGTPIPAARQSEIELDALGMATTWSTDAVSPLAVTEPRPTWQQRLGMALAAIGLVLAGALSSWLLHG